MMKLVLLLTVSLLSVKSQAFDLNLMASDAAILALSEKFQAQERLQLVDEKIQIQSNREIHAYSFQQSRLGTARVLMSAPIGYRQTRLPVLFVMAGFQTGMQSISFLQSPKDRILIGFEYPVTPDELLASPERFPESIQQSIGQAALLLAWLQEQPWVEQVDTLGVSLGTLILPASLRLSETLGFRPHKSLFAFGGAEVASMFESSFRGKIPDSVLSPLVRLVEISTLPVAPKLHLPYLHGSFLVVRGLQDEVFTPQSGELLERLLPEPKKIAHLNTRHINTDQTEIIQQTVRVIEQFLKSN